MSLRILMVAPEPFFTPRGTPFSIYHRLKALVELGHHVDLVTYPFGDDVKLDRVRIIRPRRPPGLHGVRIGPSFTKVLLDVVVFRLAARLLKNGSYDLVYTHEEASLFGAWMKKNRSISHLYDMHSLLSQQMFNFRVPFAKLLSRVWRKLERWAMQRSDAIIAICPELETSIHSLNIDKPVIVIENSGIAEFLDGVDRESVDRLRVSFPWPDRFVIGYIGTFEPYQGVDILLEAASEVIRSKPQRTPGWVLVGIPSDELLNWKSRVRKLDLLPHVHLVPKVSPEDAAIYQKAVNLLVSPRIRGTNTPLKIYSYLASGTPILATRLKTHTQVLDDRISILVEPTVQGLTEGMLRALENPQDLSSLSYEARKRFLEKYSPKVFREKTRHALSLVVGAKNPDGETLKWHNGPHSQRNP